MVKSAVGGGDLVGLLHVAGSQMARDVEKHDFLTVLTLKTVLPPARQCRFQKAVFLRMVRKMSENDPFQASPGHLILRKMTPGRSP